MLGQRIYFVAPASVSIFHLRSSMIRTFLFVLLFPFALQSQTALNKVFNLPGAVTTSIFALLIDQDTIVAFGPVIDVPGHYGVHISKFDTLGNLLDYNTYFHPEGYVLSEQTGFIKTSDGGYLGIGDALFGDTVVSFKFSHSCDLEWINGFGDANLRVIHGFLPTECDGGYMITGALQYANYDVNAFICKIDYDGNKLWQKDYGVPGLFDVGGGILQKDNNSYFISGFQSTNSGIGEPGSWARSWVFEVDSTGGVLSDWRSEISEELGGVKIELSGDHELVLIGARYHRDFPNATLTEYMTRKLDTDDWHTVWETFQTAAEMTYLYGWMDLEQNPVDGAWDVVGSFQYSSNGYVVGGLTAHINPTNGERIWIRQDTVYLSPDLNINKNQLLTLGHLSSGSIIAGGHVMSLEGDLHQEAWLLKFSLDGCIEPGNCVIVPVSEANTTNGSPFLNWEVFPNPAKTYTMLISDRNYQGQLGKISLFDGLGNLALEETFTVMPQQPVMIQLLGLSVGSYLYQVQIEGKNVGGGRILVVW